MSHFFSGNKFEHLWATKGNDKTWESRTVKLLRITLDNELKKIGSRPHY